MSATIETPYYYNEQQQFLPEFATIIEEALTKLAKIYKMYIEESGSVNEDIEIYDWLEGENGKVNHHGEPLKYMNDLKDIVFQMIIVEKERLSVANVKFLDKLFENEDFDDEEDNDWVIDYIDDVQEYVCEEVEHHVMCLDIKELEKRAA